MTGDNVRALDKSSLSALTSVPKQWLYLAGGLIWSAVGLVLFSYTIEWLASLKASQIIIFGGTGFLLAAIIAVFGFSRLAVNNIRRIADLPGGRQPFLRFQKTSSYPLILVMIILGIYLRKYSPIPKSYLATSYLGIGGGLLASSFHYYHQIWRGRLDSLQDRL